MDFIVVDVNCKPITIQITVILGDNTWAQNYSNSNFL